MQLFDKYLSNPKKMLLIDALGASLTALLLAGILVPFQEFFGMPVIVLILLAGFAGIFAGNSFIGLLWPLKYQITFLKVMVFWNSFYCCITAFLILVYFEKLTGLGLIYFISEIMIILGLVVLEIACVKRSSGKTD
ncbi:MAG: hypothetical protein ACO1N0_10470 [Fluviicola sp.]